MIAKILSRWRNGDILPEPCHTCVVKTPQVYMWLGRGRVPREFWTQPRQQARLTPYPNKRGDV